MAIEARRKTALMNVRWLMSREILHLAAVLLVFRMILSEQSAGATGLFQNLGLLNEQSASLYALMLLASVAGRLVCGALLKPTHVRRCMQPRCCASASAAISTPRPPI